jgi:2-phosphosulfolactate phosphatase
MQIRVLKMLEGAREANGLTVVIDVFRAFSVEAYLLAGGAERVIPVGDAALAYRLKEENPDYLLVGERGGRMMEGFDAGNSPSELKNLDVRGKTVVHTTSAGTQGIVNAQNAEEIITGSLVNAKAIVSYIKSKNPETVSIVSMGTRGIRTNPEDELCAEYLISLLEDREMPDIEERIASLRTNGGEHFFDPDNQEVFPEADYWMCIKHDQFPFVIRVEKDELGFVGRKLGIGRT